MVLAGVVLNRFNASWFAIRPVAGEIYKPHWMEVAILVGVAASAILIYSLVAHYFPVFDETVVVNPAEENGRKSRRLLRPRVSGD